MLADFRGSKTAILTILAAMNFEYFDIFKCEFSKKSKVKVYKMVKIVVFDYLKSATIDFT